MSQITTKSIRKNLKYALRDDEEANPYLTPENITTAQLKINKAMSLMTDAVEERLRSESQKGFFEGAPWAERVVKRMKREKGSTRMRTIPGEVGRHGNMIFVEDPKMPTALRHKVIVSERCDCTPGGYTLTPGYMHAGGPQVRFKEINNCTPNVFTKDGKQQRWNQGPGSGKDYEYLMRMARYAEKHGIEPIGKDGKKHYIMMMSPAQVAKLYPKQQKGKLGKMGFQQVEPVRPGHTSIKIPLMQKLTAPVKDGNVIGELFGNEEKVNLKYIEASGREADGTPIDWSEYCNGQ